MDERSNGPEAHSLECRAAGTNQRAGLREYAWRETDYTCGQYSMRTSVHVGVIFDR
jgi:hypothetical protein